MFFFPSPYLISIDHQQAGISIPSGNSNNKEEAIAVLTSHQFLEDFIVNNDILLPLMASKGWDAKKNELIINPKIYDTKNKKWTGKTNAAPLFKKQ